MSDQMSSNMGTVIPDYTRFFGIYVPGNVRSNVQQYVPAIVLVNVRVWTILPTLAQLVVFPVGCHVMCYINTLLI